MEPTNSPQNNHKGLGSHRIPWHWINQKALICFISLFAVLLGLGVSTKVYAQAEVLAGPAAGSKQFKAFIANQMIYPETAKAARTEQNIRLKYRIEIDGTATYLRTIDGSDPALINEAKRLIKRVVWSPAQLKNVNVPTEIELEVDFNLKKYARNVKRRGYETFVANYEVDTCSKVFVMRELEKAAIPDFGGAKNLGEYLEKNLVYPDYARKQGITGIVRVKFIIEPNGTTSNYIVSEHVAMGCTEEAIRVLEAIKWRPAFAAGKAVRSWNSASIRFGGASNDFKFQPANQFNSAF